MAPRTLRAYALVIVLVSPLFVLAPEARAPPVAFDVGAEIVARGASNGYGNQAAADGSVNVKTEGGTARNASLVLRPNGDDPATNVWASAPCQTDISQWDELREDPPDDDVTCRRVDDPASLSSTILTAMEDPVVPPGVIDDIDVTGYARLRLERGDFASAALSTPLVCGGQLNATTSAAYANVSRRFERCSGIREWAAADLPALVAGSTCVETPPLTAGIACRVTQHRAVVDIDYRDDFSLDLTSRFLNVTGVNLLVTWACTTTDSEGLDLFVDGVLAVQGVCLGSPTGTFAIPNAPIPRTVDVRLASPTTSGDVTESTYGFDVLRIEGRSNAAPVADAGPDQDVPKNSAVILNGSASYDADGDAFTFAWTKVSGPPLGFSGPGNMAVWSLGVTGSGLYVFRLTVTDAFGYASSDLVNVTVYNRDAVAGAGPDTVWRKNVVVALDGSASYDPDRDPLTYAWTQVAGLPVALSNASVESPTFVPPATGPYVFRLEVWDGEGAWDEDFVAATVANGAPVASAGPDRAVAKRATVALNGTGSTDPDGDPLSFAWTQLAGPPVLLAGVTSATPSFTPLRSGLYAFLMTVTDVDNASAADIVEVAVTNADPVANAGPDAVARAGTSVSLDGRASLDADGDPLAYAWTQVGGPAVALAAPTAATPSFVPQAAGAHAFRLVVSDGDGGTSQDDVVVTVTPDEAPVAVPTAWPGTEGHVGTRFTFDGVNSTDDGSIVSYAWDFGDGTGAPGPRPSHAFASKGSFTVTLAVTDDAGTTSTATLVVTIRNRAPAIVAHAPAGALDLAIGSSVLFAVDARDADGDALTYAWHVGALPAGTDSPFFAFEASSAGTVVVNVAVSDGEDEVWHEWTVSVRAPQSDTGALWWAAGAAAAALLGVAAFLWRRRGARPTGEPEAPDADGDVGSEDLEGTDDGP